MSSYPTINAITTNYTFCNLFSTAAISRHLRNTKPTKLSNNFQSNP